MSRETDEMIDRLADREASGRDAAYTLLVATLRQSVQVLEDVLRYKVAPETAQQIIREYLLGCMPNAAQAEQVRQMQERLVESARTAEVRGSLREVFGRGVSEAREPGDQVQDGIDRV